MTGNHLIYTAAGRLDCVATFFHPYCVPTGRGIFLYAFSTHITPLTGREREYTHITLSRRDKLWVENDFPKSPASRRDAIWVKVTKGRKGGYFTIALSRRDKLWVETPYIRNRVP